MKRLNEEDDGLVVAFENSFREDYDNPDWVLAQKLEQEELHYMQALKNPGMDVFSRTTKRKRDEIFDESGRAQRFKAGNMSQNMGQNYVVPEEGRFDEEVLHVGFINDFSDSDFDDDNLQPYY